MKFWIAIMALALAAACDKGDESFDEVPAVAAPEADGPAEPVAEDPTLPTGHPPVAESGEEALAPPARVTFESPEQFGKTGPLRWTAPAGWTAVKPASQMRLAEYLVPAEKGEPATLTVFYFGPSGGGGVDANVDRWTGQFGADGEKATRGQLTSGGMTVHTVDASGTYNAGMAAGNQPPKPNQRMLGAIVESPAGLFFFKMVGPKPVVDAQEAEWKSFVNSFAKG